MFRNPKTTFKYCRKRLKKSSPGMLKHFEEAGDQLEKRLLLQEEENNEKGFEVGNNVTVQERIAVRTTTSYIWHRLEPLATTIKTDQLFCTDVKKNGSYGCCTLSSSLPRLYSPSLLFSTLHRTIS